MDRANRHYTRMRTSPENASNPRPLGGGGGIRTQEGLSSLPVFKFDGIMAASVQVEQFRTILGRPKAILTASIRRLWWSTWWSVPCAWINRVSRSLLDDR